MRRGLFCGALVVVLSSLALGVGAQRQGGPPPRFRSNVDLVRVDVVVVDRDGRHVRGLTRADFTLLDRSRPQEIATFDEIAATRAPASPGPAPLAALDVAGNQGDQSDRLIILVVDDLHIYKDRTARAKEIARDVIDELGPQSSMAVLFTSGDHSTQVLQDRIRLHAAVDTLRGRKSWRRPHQAIDVQRAGRIDPEASTDAALATIRQAQDARLDEFGENIRQYKTLRDAARLLGTDDSRRKAFVLVSEGIGKDLTGLFGAMSPKAPRLEGGSEYAFGDVAATATTPATGYHDLSLIEMMESLRRSNVTTYAIDPRGSVASGDLLRECFPPPASGFDPCSDRMTDWDSPVRQAQHGLEILSEASGGFAVTNTDDYTAGLSRIVEDLDHYYLLGFHPIDAKGRGYRPLQVRVPGHPEWRLRFRRGYTPVRPQDARPDDRKSRAAPSRLEGLATGILPRSDLPLRVTAVPMPGGDGAAKAVIAFEVTAPRKPLEDADGKLRDTLVYELLIVDAKGKVRTLGELEGRLVLSPAQGAPPDAVTYQVCEIIDLPPGRSEIRLSALSERTSKGGSAFLPVDVPEFGGTAPVLSGMAVGYLEGPRVPSAPQRTPLPLPFVPTLDRSFSRADTLRVYVEAAGAPGLRPSIEIIDAGNRVVLSPSASFTSGRPLKISAPIELKSLAPGAYLIRASVTDGTASARREAGIVVR